MNEALSKAYRQYEKGKDYKRKLNIYQDADVCERFYADDQWSGVVSNGLPTPQFNFIKRIVNHFISCVMSQNTKWVFVPMHDIPENSTDPDDLNIQKACDIVNDEMERLRERRKIDTLRRHLLRDGALSTGMGLYVWWDRNIDECMPVKAPVKGDDGKPLAKKPMGGIQFRTIDDTDLHFGDPNDYRVDTQPYIILPFRELVSELREEARQNGVSEEEIQRITADEDIQERSGDRGKIELDGSEEDDDAKATAVLKFWMDTKSRKIMWSKSTKNVTIIKEADYEIGRYPLGWSSWDFRKNSMHGMSLVKGIIPNQVFVNKGFAMVMKNMMDTAWPKLLYNTNVMDEPNNEVGGAIPVSGIEDMRQAATYLPVGQIANYVLELLNQAIQITKNLLGATDAMLGDVKPDNHSAIIAVTQNSMIPLETVKQNMYQLDEDIGYICLEFMAAKYGTRMVTYKKERIAYDFSVLKDMKLQLKLEVGPSTFWSEIATIQSLDNLLQSEKLTFIQYLKRMPDGIIPQKQELIDEIEAQMKAQEEAAKAQAAAAKNAAVAPGATAPTPPGAEMPAMQAQGGGIPADMQMFIEAMPEELKMQLAQLPPEEALKLVQEMMQKHQIQ